MTHTANSATTTRTHAHGLVKRAFGNLLYVSFDRNIRQGEVAYIELPTVKLKAEVLEIAGDEAKLQVFEDTRDVSVNTPVEFTGDLLEAELGPGLLSSIYDGLQNPLEKISEQAGHFLPKGFQGTCLDRTRFWEFIPVAKSSQVLKRGDALGLVMEHRFQHLIMIPFREFGSFTITWVAPKGLYHVNTIIARAVDEKGLEHSFTMIQHWPIKNQLMEGMKVRPTKMMDTGSRIIDTQFPILKGGTFCTPGPFGAGKTVLQHHLAKFSSVDIVIVVACGERAGEVVEIVREFPHLTDPHTGDPLMKRTVIICNTSSMPVAAREASVYMGVTIAEYYRQMGLHVLLLADSTSRWAQAMREMSGRLEEIPGEEAFPAYLASRIASFYERSGVVVTEGGRSGSITIGGAVSPAGGNFEEPVTQATLAVVGAFLGLSRERSDSRRYPAIDPLISWSKYSTQAAHEVAAHMPEWGSIADSASKILRAADEIKKRMEVVGEEGISSEDLITYLKGELYDFCYLQQNSFDKEDSYCPLERQMASLALMGRVLTTAFQFQSHDEARAFFLALQHRLKNLNYLPLGVATYVHAVAEIETMLNV